MIHWSQKKFMNNFRIATLAFVLIILLLKILQMKRSPKCIFVMVAPTGKKKGLLGCTSKIPYMLMTVRWKSLVFVSSVWWSWMYLIVGVLESVSATRDWCLPSNSNTCSWLWKKKQQLFSFKNQRGNLWLWSRSVPSAFNPPCVICSDLC